jgi:hypothetical protein
MLFRYILFFILLTALWRFLNHLVVLGRRHSLKGPGSGAKAAPRSEDRFRSDISDAEFEILPDSPADDPPQDPTDSTA